MAAEMLLYCVQVASPLSLILQNTLECATIDLAFQLTDVLVDVETFLKDSSVVFLKIAQKLFLKVNMRLRD